MNHQPVEPHKLDGKVWQKLVVLLVAAKNHPRPKIAFLHNIVSDICNIKQGICFDFMYYIFCEVFRVMGNFVAVALWLSDVFYF